jgi:hypothetical protein
MKARKANVGGKWVAIERGVQRRPWWWPFHRELFWPFDRSSDHVKRPELLMSRPSLALLADRP